MKINEFFLNLRVWSGIVETIPDNIIGIIRYIKEIPGIGSFENTKDLGTIVNHNVLNYYLVI